MCIKDDFGLDLLAIAGWRQVRRADDDADDAFPNQEAHLRVHQATAYTYSQEIPQETPFAGIVHSVDNNRDSRV
jgi:hypothetical protein